jgi:HEPN domain-containing protein
MAEFSPASAWLQKVSDDMKSAKILLREGLITNSCYFSQQAGEKLLKAYLSLHEEPEWTHDLLRLCKKCIQYDADFEAIMDDASDLTDYATHTRYPGDESYDEQDAEDAIEKVRLIYEFTLPRIQALM